MSRDVSDVSGAVHDALTQQRCRVRFDWGPTAAETAAVTAPVVVVVDVLSFTTTVCVAVERGITVLPYAGSDDDARSYARDHRARLAAGRAAGLSPAAVATAPTPDRVVVPSPNGSAISYRLRTSGSRVLAGCLGNRSAVAGVLAAALSAGAAVAVIAAGERWPDGSLRPCAEDLWGAGAILGRLPRSLLSPEAAVAADAFAAVAGSLPRGLADCAGGRELAARGFAADVDRAACVDDIAVVPELVGDEFRRWEEPGLEPGGRWC